MPLEQFSLIRESSDWLVWRAVDPSSRERFTVKQVHPKAKIPEYLADQLSREYNFFAKLQHPGLLTPVRWSDDGPAIHFEDTQGNLAQLLQQEGTFAVDHVANVLLECAEVLDYLHGCKTGHGSLNTQTILVAPNGRIKLGDFTGYLFNQQTPPLSPDQTPRYQAPELLNSALGTCSPTSDLYCLGYVALEMLTGREFEQLFGSSRNQPGQQIHWLGWHANPTKELPDLRERLSTQQAFIDLITGLVQKKGEHRAFKAAHELIRTLKDYGLTSQRTLPRFRQAGESQELPVVEAPQRPRRTAPMRAKAPLRLAVWQGDKTVTYKFPPTQGIIVGREPVCDLVLDQDTVSRRHALLACHGNGSWWVYDLKSKAGIHVNKMKIVAPTKLADGDKIHFGKVGCRIELPRGENAEGTQRFRRVGPIRLVELLHEGGNGELHRGQMSHKGRIFPVAVRLFPRQFTFDAEQLRRFVRGVSAATRFHHPNVVRLYRGGRITRHQIWYLAMEFMPGRSLRDRLKEQSPLPINHVLGMASDILAALSAIEAERLLHRNITPSCVLFTKEGKAKLGDFLLMRDEILETVHQITRAGVIPGDKVYQPPELLFGGEASPASDLYSLGAVMYEALTGQPPFSPALNLPEMLSAVQKSEPTSLRSFNRYIQPDLEAIILRSLDKDPRKRYASASDMDRALRDITKF